MLQFCLWDHWSFNLSGFYLNILNNSCGFPGCLNHFVWEDVCIDIYLEIGSKLKDFTEKKIDSGSQCTLTLFTYIVNCFHSVCTYNHLQGQRRPLCRYDFLDLGEVEENVRRAQTCKKMRHFIVDPDLAKLVTQHLGPENAKTAIFECNPGTCLCNL